MTIIHQLSATTLGNPLWEMASCADDSVRVVGLSKVQLQALRKGFLHSTIIIQTMLTSTLRYHCSTCIYMSHAYILSCHLNSVRRPCSKKLGSVTNLGRNSQVAKCLNAYMMHTRPLTNWQVAKWDYDLTQWQTAVNCEGVAKRVCLDHLC